MGVVLDRKIVFLGFLKYLFGLRFIVCLVNVSLRFCLILFGICLFIIKIKG